MSGAFWFSLPFLILNLLVFASMVTPIGDGFFLSVFGSSIISKVCSFTFYILFWSVVRAFALKRLEPTILNLVLNFAFFMLATVLASV